MLALSPATAHAATVPVSSMQNLSVAGDRGGYDDHDGYRDRGGYEGYRDRGGYGDDRGGYGDRGYRGEGGLLGGLLGGDGLLGGLLGGDRGDRGYHGDRGLLGGLLGGIL